MNRVLVSVFLLALCPLAMAQGNRSAELDKAVEEARARARRPARSRARAQALRGRAEALERLEVK